MWNSGMAKLRFEKTGTVQPGGLERGREPAFYYVDNNLYVEPVQVDNKMCGLRHAVSCHEKAACRQSIRNCYPAFLRCYSSYAWTRSQYKIPKSSGDQGMHITNHLLFVDDLIATDEERYHEIYGRSLKDVVNENCNQNKSDRLNIIIYDKKRREVILIKVGITSQYRIKANRPHIMIQDKKRREVILIKVGITSQDRDEVQNQNYSVCDDLGWDCKELPQMLCEED
ncbi:unnamed protein product [Thelazia callipaeda]|uniref:Reverse transcriptase domain-containing protein n=1 Tax=Thelazia callipaeda TaxID=103827 RepID=A0A0N5DBI1_THECL|nr:unnamed protein product [Thelazia callipaeda]